MAGKVGCGLLLAVLFAVAAVSRAPFAVFLLAWAMLVAVFLAWYARTLRRDVTATLQLPARPVRPGEEFSVLVQLHNAGQRPVPELRVVLQAIDAESGTAIELPLRCHAGPGSVCRPARNAARRQKRLVAVPRAGNHGARPAGPVCRALRRAAPKPGTVRAAARRG